MIKKDIETMFYDTYTLINYNLKKYILFILNLFLTYNKLKIKYNYYTNI